MAVTEHGRIVLYRHFEAEMGEEKAQILMDHLLPVGWTELATTQDLRELRLATEQDLRELRLATEQDLRELRLATEQDLRELRYEFKAEFAAVRTEIADLRTEMHKMFRTHTLALMGMMFTLQGLMLAALKFL